MKEFQQIAEEETRKALEMSPEMFMNMIRPAESEEARKTFEHNNEALGNIPQDLRERILQEYKKLQAKNPHWKMNRLLKNAGKKHNVHFTFE